MDVIISNKKINRKKYILNTFTLDGYYIYIDTDNNLRKNKKYYNYLISGYVKYVSNKDFDFNHDIEINLSGIMNKNNYVNIDEIYLDERDLFISDKLYIVILINSSIDDKQRIKNILINNIFTDNEIMDVNDNRIKIYDLNISNIIRINNVNYIQ